MRAVVGGEAGAPQLLNVMFVPPPKVVPVLGSEAVRDLQAAVECFQTKKCLEVTVPATLDERQTNHLRRIAYGRTEDLTPNRHGQIPLLTLHHASVRLPNSTRKRSNVECLKHADSPKS